LVKEARGGKPSFVARDGDRLWIWKESWMKSLAMKSAPQRKNFGGAQGFIFGHAKKKPSLVVTGGGPKRNSLKKLFRRGWKRTDWLGRKGG